MFRLGASAIEARLKTFKRGVCTSKKTQPMIIAKIKRLMLVKEISLTMK